MTITVHRCCCPHGCGYVATSLSEAATLWAMFDHQRWHDDKLENKEQ